MFVYKGKMKVNGKLVDEKSAVYFELSEETKSVEFCALDEQCKFLWISGQPIKEKVEWYGPFVMN